MTAALWRVCCVGGAGAGTHFLRQIRTNIDSLKLILEINKYKLVSGTEKIVEKLVHISLFPNSNEDCRGIHISSDKNSSIKSRLYIKHKLVEDSLGYGHKNVKKVISIIFKSVGKYFSTRIWIVIRIK